MEYLFVALLVGASIPLLIRGVRTYRMWREICASRIRVAAGLKDNCQRLIKMVNEYESGAQDNQVLRDLAEEVADHAERIADSPGYEKESVSLKQSAHTLRKVLTPFAPTTASRH